MAEEDPPEVLSDVEGDGDPSPIVLPISDESSPTDPRLRQALADLERERTLRKAAEDSRADLENRFNRLKALTHEALKKRDEASRERDEAVRSADRVSGELSEAARQRDALKAEIEAAARQRDALKAEIEVASRQRDASKGEIETAAQMLVQGIDKISAKAGGGGFKAAGLPRSQKYTGLPAVAYGVVARANEIVEELTRQVEAAARGRDQAREAMEQRNYEIAIEVSDLEATIGGLRQDLERKSSEVEDLTKTVADMEVRASDLEGAISEARGQAEDWERRTMGLEAKIELQRPLLVDQLINLSKLHNQVHEIIRGVNSDGSDVSDSSFVWEEAGDPVEVARVALEGTVSVCEEVRVMSEKVRERIEADRLEAKRFNETVGQLMAEKKHVGSLLRSALAGKNESDDVLRVAENGLKEVGMEIKFSSLVGDGGAEEDEVYTLAGALENIVKASQLEIIELQHSVDMLRAESSLLKTHVEAQEKEISKLKQYIKELEEKEQVANENVEGLMMDIAAAEEEISRWKGAAEQEAAAGKAVEQEFVSQLSALRQDLEEAKQALVESENKLKFKEETAAAAMAARDAAEKSLKLADLRASRLRERLEELTQQLDESGEDSRNPNGPRYMCWPWKWLGMDFVGQHSETQQGSNEMELSEPLL
ncbi:hypothetical protein QJS10_CPA16g00351 [Acorus calamus]|uniref:Uncharacterized protein n=1 Tax=Acorus calamus TaxID=4465 RepID=A0AAV9CY94_ACOCL|nr:hypothetical protein QJS10_CPA16g00351 [Acorus calamus]